ncbi:MAG: DUF3368 domain-containing protein [Bryobacteraceae bacterium]
MQVVVADTTPLRYLVVIEAATILPMLFERVLIPLSVRDELTHPATPRAVQEWVASAPAWLEVLPDPTVVMFAAPELGPGERAAIALAEEVHADLVLMDDRIGIAAARSRGLAVTGTIGVLDLAARRGMLDLGAAFARLQETNFRYPPDLVAEILAEHRRKSNLRPGGPE